MPLYVKDREVGELADRLASLKGVTKTQAVREALRNEIERNEELSPYVKKGLAFARELRRRAGPGGQPVDKAWIDSLYED